jgi:hypothetical protein
MFGSAKKSDDHKHIIELLARQSGASIDEVAVLYEQERQALEARSRVKAFVPVLVIRRVRDLLRQHASNNTAETRSAA